MFLKIDARTGVVLAIIVTIVLFFSLLFAADGRNSGGGEAGGGPQSCPHVRIYAVNTGVYPQGRYDLYSYAEGVILRCEDKGGVEGGGQEIR